MAGAQVRLLSADEATKAAFTVSRSPSGDKMNSAEEAANRLGSFLGLMAQAGNVAPEASFVPGDLKSARLFGERFAKIVVSRS